MMLGCKKPEDVIKAIKDHGVEMIDLRFTDQVVVVWGETD